MKTSRYNVYFKENKKHFVYNQLTSAIIEVDRDTFKEFEDGTLDDNDLDADQKLNFMDSNFLTTNDHEEDMVLYLNRNVRYNSKIARITIMPTLECNFSCWYCYEDHVQGRMTKEMADLTYKLIENMITNSKLSVFHLDWFGGEPLICFDEIVYPLSKRIKEKCLEKGIQFRNNITTNGYLITTEMIKQMKEINLNVFQITLDGNKENHNKSRFTNTDSNTYKTIVNNVTNLCKEIDYINMSLRINYTPDNILSMDEIADSFPEEIRGKIQITPQRIWQFKETINSIDQTVFEKITNFEKKGYCVSNVFTTGCRGMSCYTENHLQFVINYDGKIFKCTARDFASGKTSIGHIDGKGDFKPNSYYYKYFTSSAFENERCLKCEYLPTCMGTCIQKKIENIKMICPKKSIKESLLNQLRVIVNDIEKQSLVTENVG